MADKSVDEKTKEEMSKEVEEYLERKREEELEYEARNIIMAVVKRESDVIARFAEYRVMELFTKGLVMNYNMRREFDWNRARIIIELEIPEHVVEVAKRRLGELRGLLVKVMREARKDDRYKYRFD